MKVVFEKKDYMLCSVPVPKGYPQSQTHVGVMKLGGSTLLTSSPYPSVRRETWKEYLRAIIRRLSFGYFCKNIRGEFFENPCLYISADGISFRLLRARPLMETPDPEFGLPAFNSDPDLFIESNNIYTLNRAIYRTKLTPERKRDEYIIRIYLIKGQLINNKYKYISTSLFKETTDLIVSPCLTYFKGKYIYTSLWTNCYNDGEDFDGMRFIKSNTIDGLSNNENWLPIEVNTDIWIPWHMSLFVHNDTLYTIVACVKRGQPRRCYQMLGVFDQKLQKLTIYPQPLTDYNSYRGAAYVDYNDQFVLYSTTVDEKLKGGMSCDGREIIMTSKLTFREVLRKVQGE